jgi:quercetin dioxygenase-like cupin family protein
MKQNFEAQPNVQEIIDRLKGEGYDNVYEWNAKPNEIDDDHEHPFDTRLVVLEGAIVVTMEGQSFAMISGGESDIPRSTAHSAKAGAKGCKYIVAEKY